MMVTTHEGERRRPPEVVSDREQPYLAHAQCLTKKSVQWGGKSLAKSGETAQCLMEKNMHGGLKLPAGSSPTAQCLMRKSVHSERMKNDHTAQVQTWASIADSCGHASACMCEYHNLHVQECENNTHDVQVRGCLCTFTCQNARSENINVNMYEKAEVYRNKCAGEKPTTCGIKACIYMCEEKKRTHAYACYGHACTAQCTCSVVCMCGKKHAQESENNDNNDIKSSEIIRFKNMDGTK